MPDNKNQHFVPAFLLRQIAGNAKCISLFAISQEKLVSTASILGQCSKPYFYGTDLRLEKSLSGLEGQASTIIKKINTDATIPKRGTLDYFTISEFIAAQIGRTTTAEDQVNDGYNGLLQLALKHDSSAPKLDTPIKIKSKNAVGLSLFLSIAFYPVLLDLSIKVLRAKGSSQFIIGDNPAIVFNSFYGHGVPMK